MKRTLTVIALIILVLLTVTTPVIAQQDEGLISTICDKTYNGEVVTQENPNYEKGEFSPFIYLLQNLMWLILIGVPIAGTLLAIYASIADLFYSGSEDEGSTKYLQMRSSGIFAAIGIPVLLVAGDLLLDFLLGTDVTCFIPTPF